MAMRLPVGLRKVLDDDTNFLKRDKPVVDRLRDSDCGLYISVMHKIDTLILEFNPVHNDADEDEYDPRLFQWNVFCELLVHCSIIYSKENADNIRGERKTFAKKLKNISKLSAELAKEMRTADNLGAKFGFIENVDVHPLELLQAAVTNQANTETLGRYNDFFADKVELAMGELKNFPTIPQLLDELSRQYARDFEMIGSANVLPNTSKVNDFCRQFYNGLTHLVDINLLSAKVIEDRVITKFNWASMFSIALGYEITEQNIKDSQK